MDLATTTTTRADLTRAARWSRGKLATLAEFAMVGSFAGDDPRTAEDVEREREFLAEMEDVRRDVAGPDPSPLERLIADRVAIAYFELHLLDLLLSHINRDARPGLERRRERAERRYLAGLQALARVRRLVLPPMLLKARNQQVIVNPR